MHRYLYNPVPGHGTIIVLVKHIHNDALCRLQYTYCYVSSFLFITKHFYTIATSRTSTLLPRHVMYTVALKRINGT